MVQLLAEHRLCSPDRPTLQPDEMLTATLTARNTSSPVAQAYVHDVASTLAAFDEVRTAWVVGAGEFELHVGTSSTDTLLPAGFTLAGEWSDAVSRLEPVIPSSPCR